MRLNKKKSNLDQYIGKEKKINAGIDIRCKFTKITQPDKEKRRGALTGCEKASLIASYI